MLTPLCRQVRAWLLRWVRSGTSTVVAFQAACGVSSKVSADGSRSISIRYPLLHYFFLTAAAAGNELAYIVGLPALYWFVDVPLARRVCISWTLIYFVGQSAKDLARLPRPPSPPVTKLETHYETEYGWPSTHAMVSLVLPLYMVYAAVDLGHALSLPLCLLLCFIWCASITLSRLYCGVHSVCDLVGGLLLGSCVLAVSCCIGANVDEFIIHHPFAPIAALLISTAAIWSYPAPLTWTNAYGDTSLIIAVGAGISCASSVYCQRFESMNMSISGDTYMEQLLSCGQIALFFILRLAIGCCILFLTRSGMKRLSQSIWLPLALPSYLVYCSTLPSPVASPECDSDVRVDATKSAADTDTSYQWPNGTANQKKHNKTDSPRQKCDATADDDGEWELTPMPTTQQDGLHQRATNTTTNAEVTTSGKVRTSAAHRPSPVAIPSSVASANDRLTPVPPLQFRFGQSGLGQPCPVGVSGLAPCPSPISALLSTFSSAKSLVHPSTSTPQPSPRHKLLPATDTHPCLVEFLHAASGRTFVINPLHIYLIEVPIKFVTYFAVGFNAVFTVPLLFKCIGL